MSSTLQTEPSPTPLHSPDEKEVTSIDGLASPSIDWEKVTAAFSDVAEALTDANVDVDALEQRLRCLTHYTKQAVQAFVEDAAHLQAVIALDTSEGGH